MKFSLDEIKDLLDAFEERNMHKLQLKHGEYELLLERNTTQNEIITTAPIVERVAAPHQASMHQLPAHFPSADKAASAEPVAEDSNAKYITTPMVGTFYKSSAPGEASFVSVGDTVKEGDVVCIVEAMKVMNEVKSTESGVVKEILVDDGQPVEFGTKIFKLG